MSGRARTVNIKAGSVWGCSSRWLVCGMTTVLAVGKLQAAGVIVDYQFPQDVAGAVAPSTLALGVDSTPLSATGNLPISSHYGMTSESWSSMLDLSRYLTFTVTPPTGPLQLSSLQFCWYSDTPNGLKNWGPATVEVRWNGNGDNFQTVLGSFTFSNDPDTVTHAFSGTDAVNLNNTIITGATEFRFYAYGEREPGAGTSADAGFAGSPDVADGGRDLTLEGTVVPEPMQIASATALSLLAAGAYRRLRSRRTRARSAARTLFRRSVGLVLLVCGVNLQATPTLLDGSVGWTSSTDTSGLTVGGRWADSRTSLSWDISQTSSGLWHYRYTLTTAKIGGKLLVIETDPAASLDDFSNMQGLSSAAKYGDFTTDSSPSGVPSGILHGLAVTGSKATLTFSFDSEWAPRWGDFYSKEVLISTTGIQPGSAVNRGFVGDQMFALEADQDPVGGAYIAVPGRRASVPEAGLTIVYLGLGLLLIKGLKDRWVR